jgi:hypothetical protein
MSEQQQHDELTPEEVDELHAEELPTREALSVLRVPFLGTAAPVEAQDAVVAPESEPAEE